jgi:hypothetical protein
MLSIEELLEYLRQQQGGNPPPGAQLPSLYRQSVNNGPPPPGMGVQPPPPATTPPPPPPNGGVFGPIDPGPLVNPIGRPAGPPPAPGLPSGDGNPIGRGPLRNNGLPEPGATSGLYGLGQQPSYRNTGPGQSPTGTNQNDNGLNALARNLGNRPGMPSRSSGAFRQRSPTGYRGYY